jgi:hypothetical protein
MSVNGYFLHRGRTESVHYRRRPRGSAIAPCVPYFFGAAAVYTSASLSSRLFLSPLFDLSFEMCFLLPFSQLIISGRFVESRATVLNFSVNVRKLVTWQP